MARALAGSSMGAASKFYLPGLTAFDVYLRGPQAARGQSSPVHGVDGSSPGGLEHGCRLQVYDFGPENSALYSAFLEALRSDLAQLVAAWPTLSEHVRRGILAMVEAMRQRPDTRAVPGAVQS